MIRALLDLDRERLASWCCRRALGACIVTADPTRCEARCLLALVAAAGWLALAGVVGRAEGAGGAER